MSTTIRQYQVSDLADLMATWENSNNLAHPFLNEDFIAQVRKDIPALYLPNADTWVVEVNQRVVGFIALIGNEVGAIFLQPEYQGNKIGKMMMDKAQELHGAIELEVFKNNSIGRQFYSKYGFKLLEEKIHEPTGETVLRLRFTAC
ncbi:MAG: GNAT family N-acetyltransferase [Oceanospirillaceae bacterium]